MITRRSLFGFFPALGALAVPAVKPDEYTVADTAELIILEHICDAGKSLHTPAEVAERDAYWRKEFGWPPYWGCGTRFQWVFGMMPVCPKCGLAYDTRLELIRRGVYRVVKGKLPQ